MSGNFIDVATIWLHAGKGGDGADHEAVAATQARARQDRDGRDGLDVGNRAEQHAARGGNRPQHDRGHDLAQARARALVATREQPQAHDAHEHGETRRGLDVRDRARHERHGHRHERRHLEQAQDASHTVLLGIHVFEHTRRDHG